MICLELFWSFVQIGLLSIGGGYAAMPLIQEQVVDRHHWITMSQFADMMSISEMTPGPTAINSATFVGTQVAGVLGALAATFGCVLPSLVIVLTLAWVYYRIGPDLFRPFFVFRGMQRTGRVVPCVWAHSFCALLDEAG